MPKNKKSFIGKSENAVHFSLANRSQRDPLIASEASQHVLVPLSTERLDPDKKREEQHKYGIYFEDNYDYLKHLRDTSEMASLEPIEERFRITKDGTVLDLDAQSTSKSAPKLMLPAELFETLGMELETGLLNQAAPNKDPKIGWDADIVAALDDDFDFDDPDAELEDDFILKANAACSGDEALRADDDLSDSDDEHEWSAEVYASKHSDRGQLPEEFFDNDNIEETRSRFTNYSMTSSVIRRTAGLKLLDDMFEKVYEEYDEDGLGSGSEDGASSDADERMIDPNSDRMLQMVQEYQDDKELNRTLAKRILESAEKCELREGASSDEEPMERTVVGDTKGNWDCESILTTNSTLYNHPAVIKLSSKTKQIKVNPKTGLPCGVLKMEGLTAQQLKLLDDTDSTVVTTATARSKASTFRPKKLETAEQRRLRKQAVRLERRERREEKKATKLAFSCEKKLQERSKLNLNNGIKLV